MFAASMVGSAVAGFVCVFAVQHPELSKLNPRDVLEDCYLLSIRWGFDGFMLLSVFNAVQFSFLHRPRVTR